MHSLFIFPCAKIGFYFESCKQYHKKVAPLLEAEAQDIELFFPTKKLLLSDVLLNFFDKQASGLNLCRNIRFVYINRAVVISILTKFLELRI